MHKRAAYVTTPIFYPNDVPHLGTAYPVVAADIVARWERLRGKESFLLTGTDEHGKKIEIAATQNGTSPQEFVDRLATSFKTAFAELNVRYDRFIRTTDEDHVHVVREILKRVHDNGDIYKGVYEGLYCLDCEAYYVPEELKAGLCPLHLRPPENLKEECYYFRLAQYQDWLLAHYKANPKFILPETRRNEVISFVTGGLEDLCISRTSFNWGIPFPFDNRHVTYVWFDALINYLTGAGFLHNDHLFKSLWPTTTHIIGKDILRFHAVIWPAMLASAGIHPPQQVFAHGFWTVEGHKFSKSLGNVILPGYLVEKYGVDPLRYYMFREFPFGSDGDFSVKNLVRRNNSELAQGLGNLVQRITTMVQNYRAGEIPSCRESGASVKQLGNLAELTVIQVTNSLAELALGRALGFIWEFIGALNAYASKEKPWILARENDSRLDTVLAQLVEGLRFISTLVFPFMPTSGQEIANRIGLNKPPQVDELHWAGTLAGKNINYGPPLFRMLVE